jgi:hypothetical protein
VTSEERDSVSFKINLNTIISVLGFLLMLASILAGYGRSTEQLAQVRSEVTAVRRQVEAVQHDVTAVRERVARLEGPGR